MKDKILKENKLAWDHIADDWFGSTALPTYAPLMKTEDDLNLFGNIEGKRVLDIGCGSGHSLKYMGDHKAKELWGLDLSTSQIENAKSYLSDNHFSPHLFNCPMETNPGIPTDYFDIVYSIYAFGWTVDLKASLKQVSKYLKSGGIFVMSWDHPMIHTYEVKDKDLLIKYPYHEVTKINLQKGGFDLTLNTWKLSTYIEGLKEAGMYLDTWVEDVDEKVFEKDYNDMNKYYSHDKAKLVPLSMILKAVKL